MGDEIINELQGITNQAVSHDTKRVIIIDLDLKVSVEQFRKFQEWLISKGFIEEKLVGDDVLKLLFMELDYEVNGDLAGRQVIYRHVKDKKTINITYRIGDGVTIESIIYFEKV